MYTNTNMHICRQETKKYTHSGFIRCIIKPCKQGGREEKQEEKCTQWVHTLHNMIIQAGGRGRKMHTVDIYFAQYDHAGRREGEKCATRTQSRWFVPMIQSVTVNGF